MIFRRAFLAGSVTLFAAPFAAGAQPARRVYKIGVLGAATATVANAEAFRQGLREFGYTDGQNIAVDWGAVPPSPEVLPDLVAALVRGKVDIIVAPNNPAIQAAQRGTKTIPVVMLYATDPVGLGFVTSLARPGGNITGMSSQEAETAGKRLELLRQAVPGLSRLIVLWNPDEAGRRQYVSAVEAAARGMRLPVQPLETRDTGDLDRVFASPTRSGVEAVLVGGSTLHFVQRARIAELAVKRHVPVMCPTRDYVAAGCLLSYFVNFTEQYRRAAYFIDKILRGAAPADLPVEQPTRFELVINLKTAKALGLTIPASLLLRADQVIE